LAALNIGEPQKSEKPDLGDSKNGQNGKAGSRSEKEAPKKIESKR
jgi:hypothetical protein